VKEIVSDVESYIVAWSLTNTVETMEQMIEERKSGAYPNGVFDKNKAKDLRLLKDHRDAAEIFSAAAKPAVGVQLDNAEAMHQVPSGQATN